MSELLEVGGRLMSEEPLRGVPESLQAETATLWAQIEQADASVVSGLLASLITPSSSPVIAQSACEPLAGVGLVQCLWSCPVSDCEVELAAVTDTQAVLHISSASHFWSSACCGSKPRDGLTRWHLLPPELRLRHRSEGANMAMCICERDGAPAVAVFWPILPIASGDELCINRVTPKCPKSLRAIMLSPYVSWPGMWAVPEELEAVRTKLETLRVRR